MKIKSTAPWTPGKDQLVDVALDRVSLAGALPAQVSATLPVPERTPEGYWKVWGYAARAGNVQAYPEHTGPASLQYRPQEAIFSAQSLESYRGRPVIVGHPTQAGGAVPMGLLDPTTVQAHSQGSVLQATAAYNVAGVTGLDLVLVEMLITGASAVAQVESPTGLRELSVGYWRLLDAVSGVSPSGEAYTSIVRHVHTNHIAMEPVGRAGPEARFRGQGDSKPKEPTMEFVEITLPDGRIVRVAKEDASVVRSTLTATDGQVSRVTADLSQAQADAAALRQEAEIKDATIATLEADLKQARAQSDAVAVEGLRRDLTPLLPGKDLAAMDAAALRGAAVDAAWPEIAGDFSPEQVAGMYDKALTKLQQAKGASLDGVKKQLEGTETDGADEAKSIAELRQANLDAQANAWRKSPSA